MTGVRIGFENIERMIPLITSLDYLLSAKNLF
jgi:hypothetical protein